MKVRNTKPNPSRLRKVAVAERNIEAQTSVSDLHQPDHLDEIAKTEWNRIVPILCEMGVARPGDYIALGILCQSYSHMVQASEKICQEGVIIVTPRGLRPSPYLSIVMQSMQTVNRLRREFGPTLASRAKLSSGRYKSTPRSTAPIQ